MNAIAKQQKPQHDLSLESVKDMEARIDFLAEVAQVVSTKTDSTAQEELCKKAEEEIAYSDRLVDTNPLNAKLKQSPYHTYLRLYTHDITHQTHKRLIAGYLSMRGENKFSEISRAFVSLASSTTDPQEREHINAVVSFLSRRAPHPETARAASVSAAKTALGL